MALNSENFQTQYQHANLEEQNLSRNIRNKILPSKFIKKGIIQDLAIDHQGHHHNEHSD